MNDPVALVKRFLERLRHDPDIGTVYLAVRIPLEMKVSDPQGATDMAALLDKLEAHWEAAKAAA